MRRLTFTIHGLTDEDTECFMDAIDNAAEKLFESHPNVSYGVRYEHYRFQEEGAVADDDCTDCDETGWNPHGERWCQCDRGIAAARASSSANNGGAGNGR